jgi:hypothetical protein
MGGPTQGIDQQQPATPVSPPDAAGFGPRLAGPSLRLALLLGLLLAVAAWAPRAAHAFSFSAPTNKTVGTSPVEVAVGQFNGDSDPDLAVANELSNNVSVLLGSTGATFTGPTNFAVGTGPLSVAVGDFNGDSDPDLVTANESSNNVSVLVGGAGGSFSGPTNFSVCSAPLSVAVGDFNGDSDPDLAVANELCHVVSILLGGAGATFGSPTNFATGDLPSSVAVGEFNGDSDPDLAVANDGTDNVSILLGSTGGTFTGPTNFTVGDGPDTIAIDEYNGDSDPDIAVANELSNNVSVLLGSTGGTFTGPTNFGVGSAPLSVTADDFNGDPDPDLAVSNEVSDNVSILVGSTGGTFTGPTNFAAGDGPASVASADFNADTDADLATANEFSNNVSILLGDSTPPAKPTLTATDPVSPANNNSPKVKGTAAAGSTVRIYKAALTSDCTPANLLATGTAAAFASPGITVSVPDNSSTRLRATATDGANNSSGCSVSSKLYVEDSTAPPGPLLTDTDPDSPANNNTPFVKGTAQASSTVRLYKAPTTTGCTAANLVATGTAAAFASPGFQATVPDNSTTRFRATATDKAGNVSPCSGSSRLYVEDSTAPPAPSLTATDPPSPANNNLPKVKGTAQAGSTVRIYKAATTADCTPANLAATGTAAELASPGIEASVPDNSTTRFRAIASDAAGNASPCTATARIYVEDSIAPPPPQLTATDPPSPANNNSPKIKGTAQGGSTVRLYKAPTTADCSPGNLAATGSAAAFASPGLAVSVPDNSTTRFRGTASDPAGNTSACSTNSIVYVEDSLLAPAALATGFAPGSVLLTPPF